MFMGLRDKTIEVIRAPEKRDKTIQVLMTPNKTAKTIEVLRLQIRQKKQ